jgi:dihydropteroate synthase
MNPATFRQALDGDAVLLMGIVNVTPDSFSDGGQFLDHDLAVAHGLQLAAQGADIVDVGGESTRPGAAPIDEADEERRVVPVVRRLAAEGLAVSIDTRHAAVADAAVAAGACVINDVTGLRDPAMRTVAATRSVPAVVMHMPVTDPAVMQQHTGYADVVGEVRAFLETHAALAIDAGVPRVMIDPGIGFGKTAQNIELVRQLEALVDLGYPVLIGASRKRFIGELGGAERADERGPGTLAVHLAAVANGARLVRAHDVAAHRQALALWHHLSR